MQTTETLLTNAYAAFNHRNITTALALMCVTSTKAWEGGYVTGKAAIR